MLKVKQFCFNPFGENTYIVYDSDDRSALVVDPGMWSDAERKAFDDYVSDNKLEINQIVNTHMHIDHCMGDNYVKNKYGVKVAANRGDAPLAARLAMQAARFGFKKPVDPVEIDVDLKDGEVIKVGGGELLVLQVPGHSPGGIALYAPAEKFVLTGDSLFHGAIGRTDLEGGDYAQLVKNVTDKLLALPDDTLVLPGHEEHTTIGAERRSNPFL